MRYLVSILVCCMLVLAVTPVPAGNYNNYSYGRSYAGHGYSYTPYTYGQSYGSCGQSYGYQQYQPSYNQYNNYDYQKQYDYKYDYQKVITVPVVVPSTTFQFLPAYSGGARETNREAPETAALARKIIEQPADEDEPLPRPRKPSKPSKAQGLLRAPAPEADEEVASADTDHKTSVLSARCAMCHTGSAAKGDVVIFSKEGVRARLSRETQQAIEDAVTEKTMPPKKGGGPLQAAEARALMAEIRGKVVARD